MSQTAAYLVDHVIPFVPVRQWVLSLPIPLRLLLAAQPQWLTPVLQVVQRELMRNAALRTGISVRQGQGGAVTLIQRFGSAANLNVHLHCLVLDGMYRREQQGQAKASRNAPAADLADQAHPQPDDGTERLLKAAPVDERAVEFVTAKALTEAQLQQVLERIIGAVMKRLMRLGVAVAEHGQPYLAEIEGQDAQAQALHTLQAAAITYRVAFGERAGQKLLTLRGAAARALPIAASVVR